MIFFHGIQIYNQSTWQYFIEQELPFTKLNNSSYVSFSYHWKAKRINLGFEFDFIDDGSPSKKEASVPLYEETEASFFNRIRQIDNPIESIIQYDQKKGKFLIARNHFGTIPLFYIHLPHLFFAFSTDIQFLQNLRIPNLQFSINSYEIYKYLGVLKSDTYDTNTIYKEISSLAPGHYGIANKESFTSKYYIDYQPKKWSHLSSATDYGVVFKSLFLKSIRHSCANHQTLGSHLSGGLDSSSVSASIKTILPERDLHTFFSFTNTALTNEGHYATEVAKKIKSIHHTINPGTSDLDSLIQYTRLHGQPERSPISTALHHSIIKEASENGCSILLTGHDGDSIVGHGREEYISQLFAQKEWEELKLQFDNLVHAKRTGYLFDESWSSFPMNVKQRKIYEYYINKQIIKNLKGNHITKAIELIKIGYYRFNLIPTGLIRNVLDNLLKRINGRHQSKIKSGLIGPVLRMGSDFQNDIGKIILPEAEIAPYNYIIFKNSIHINQEYFAVSNHYKLRTAFPFYSPELYELCYSIPLQILFNNGVGRSPLRESMKGILPESVRTRTDKAIFNHYTINSIHRLLDQSRDFFTETSPIWHYIERQNFDLMIKQFRSDPFGEGMQFRGIINRIISLAVWLKLNQKSYSR